MIHNLLCHKTLYTIRGRKYFTAGRTYRAEELEGGDFFLINDLGGGHYLDARGTGEDAIENWFRVDNLCGKVIILNSPPAAGKNALADALTERTGASHKAMKDKLYILTDALFGLSEGTTERLNDDREQKERRHPFYVISTERFNDLQLYMKTGYGYLTPSIPDDGCMITVREALIYVSELVVKPSFGSAYFGKELACNVDLESGTVVSDGGFSSEIQEVVNKVGKENVYVVQFTREGASSFEGDSRGWVNLEGVKTLRTTNNGTITELCDEVLEWIKEN